MANSVDPDQMLQNVASDLDLHYLLRPVCPNIWGYYLTLVTQISKLIIFSRFNSLYSKFEFESEYLCKYFPQKLGIDISCKISPVKGNDLHGCWFLFSVRIKENITLF